MAAAAAAALEIKSVGRVDGGVPPHKVVAVDLHSFQRHSLAMTRTGQQLGVQQNTIKSMESVILAPQASIIAPPLFVMVLMGQ